MTKIPLKKATSGSGITYSQAVFTFERVLNADEKSAVGQMVEQVKEYAAGLTIASLVGTDDTPFVDAETGEIIEPLK